MERQFHEWEGERLTDLKLKLSVLATALDNNDFGLSIDDDTSEIIICDHKNSNEKILVLRTEDIRILCNALKKGVDGSSSYNYNEETKDRLSKTLKEVAKNNPDIQDMLRGSVDPKITEVFTFPDTKYIDKENHKLDRGYDPVIVLFYDGYSHAEILLSPSGQPSVEVSMYGVQDQIELDKIFKNLERKFNSFYSGHEFYHSVQNAKWMWDIYACKKDDRDLEQKIIKTIVDIKEKIEELRIKSEEEAKKPRMLEKAAEQGDAVAKDNLGLMYYEGKGIEKDYIKAAEWFEKAAELGDKYAQCNLGYMYDTGKGVEKDYVKAVEWYRKAAEQGLARAQNNLAVKYENGEGVPRDYEKAIEWYEKAAKQGNANAQNNLGVIYEKGEHAKQDYTLAVKWYEKAAEQGHAYAQRTLAEMYDKGKGVPQDYVKAAKWYEKAAEQGIKVAQFRLGIMYEKGEGVPQDLTKAAYWLKEVGASRCMAFNMQTRSNRQKRCSSLNNVIEKITSPKLKDSIIKTRDEYWNRIEQLNKPDYTDEDREQIQQENDRIDKYLRKIEKIAAGIPVKHILYCEQPGFEFRKEIKSSQVGVSYEDDNKAYRDKLNVYIDKILAKQDLEKIMEVHYDERDVEPEGSFTYSEVLQKITEKRPKDYSVEIKLDNIGKNGKIISTDIINIKDFYKRNPKYLQKTYLFEAANEYISHSISRFVKESCWQYELYNDEYYYDELDRPDQWPTLTEDGTWVDEDEELLYPRLWFGLKDEIRDDLWVLDGSNMDFWFDKCKESCFIKYDNKKNVGCYHGNLPDMKPVREKCPVIISEDDTPESIKEKVQKFLIRQYQLITEPPAKYVLYCNYPGAEFKEEIDASKISGFYTKDYDSYRNRLDDTLCDRLEEQDFDKFLDKFFTKDRIPASGHICLDEVRTDVFGNGGFPLNKDIRIYLDTVSKDGTIINTEEINIEDYVNLESKKEQLMECGLWGQTDEYIETSLEKFVKETGWHVALENGNIRIEDVQQWPSPKKDGTWVNKDGVELHPRLWYGYNDGSEFTDEEDRIWNIDNGLEFWFSEDPEDYIIEYNYDGFAGCYGGSIPDIEAIRKRCPILLESDDTPESIEKKVQEFCIKQYRKAH